MVERHDFIPPTNSDALFVNHNMVVELVSEYVRRAVFPLTLFSISIVLCMGIA